MRSQVCSCRIAMTYSNLGCLGEGYAMHVLANHSLYMTIVPWDVLKAHLVSWTSNPVFGVPASRPEHILFRLISYNKSSSSRRGSIKPYGMRGPSLRSPPIISHLNLRPAILDNNAIDLTGSHPEEIVLGRHEACVAREIVFLKNSSPLI